MSELPYKDVQTVRLPAFFRFKFPFLLFYSIAVCLLLFSMSLSAAENSGLECEAITQGQAGKGGIPPTTDLFEIARPEQGPHLTCLSSAQQIHEGWTKDEILLIDVRRADEFDKYRIPGSLNLAPFSVAAKSFLKQKHIVLVNEGRQLSQLQTLCERLKNAGFQQTAVLSGGLYAWHQAGFPIAGEKLEASRLKQISPAELISSLHERDWKYIDLDQSLPHLANRLPMADVIEYQTDKRRFIAAINRAAKESGEQRLSGYVVVSAKGDDYSKVESLLRLTNAKNVFYLKGGISEFERYLHTHADLVTRAAKGFKEPHRCSG